jgi:hypothetical protein
MPLTLGKISQTCIRPTQPCLVWHSTRHTSLKFFQSAVFCKMCLIINGNLQKANIHLKVCTMGTCFDRKPFTSLTYLAFRKNTCESFRKKSSVPLKELRFSLVFVLKLPVHVHLIFRPAFVIYLHTSFLNFI